MPIPEGTGGPQESTQSHIPRNRRLIATGCGDLNMFDNPTVQLARWNSSGFNGAQHGRNPIAEPRPSSHAVGRDSLGGSASFTTFDEEGNPVAGGGFGGAIEFITLSGTSAGGSAASWTSEAGGIRTKVGFETMATPDTEIPIELTGELRLSFAGIDSGTVTVRVLDGP